MRTGIRSVSLPRVVNRAALLAFVSLAWATPQVQAQLPKAGHVVVVVEGTRDYSDVFHTTMPYLDSLATQYGYASNYYANTTPQIGNSMMMTTGAVAANSNSYTGTVSSDNLVRQLLVLGKTWKSYAESLPSAGYTGGDVTPYVKYRNPFAYFTDVANSTNQKSNLAPFSQFATDLNNGTLPNLSWVVPNLSNSANWGTRAVADTWLKNNIGPLLANPAFKADGVLIILFEQALTDTTNGGGKVYAVVVSPAFSKTGYISKTFYQHQSLLRTVLGLLGGSVYPGSASTAPAMTEFFKAPAPAPTATLSASPASITAGQSSTLTWSTTNATSVTLNGSAVATSGSKTVSPTSTTTYTLTATGAGGTVTKNVTVTTASQPTPAPTATVSANPMTLTAGGSTTLTWSSTNATSATLNGSAVATSGSQTVSPSATTTYTLSVTGAGGSASSNVTVTVTVSVPPPTTHSATLNWTDPNPSGITSYKVYRAAGTLNSTGASVASCGTLAVLSTVSAPTKTYTDSAVTAGAGYCYAVSAVSSVAESAKSGTVMAVIPGGTTSPTPPSSTPGPAPAYVQSNHAATSGSTACSVAYPASNAAGNLLVFVVRMTGTGRTVTVNDSAGNTLWKQAAKIDQTTDGHGLAVWYAWNSKAGANTVTGAVSGAGTTLRCQALEYSGVLSTADPLDKVAAVSSGPVLNTTPDSGATPATTQASELLFGAASVANTPAISAGTDGNGHGMIIRQNTSSEKVGAEDVTVSAAQAARATFTLSSSDYWLGIVAAFKGK